MRWLCSPVLERGARALCRTRSWPDQRITHRLDHPIYIPFRWVESSKKIGEIKHYIVVFRALQRAIPRFTGDFQGKIRDYPTSSWPNPLQDCTRIYTCMSTLFSLFKPRRRLIGCHVLLSGHLRACYWILCSWYIVLSFLLSEDCSTWVAYVPAAALFGSFLYVAIIFMLPTCMRPGGSLAFLRHRKLAFVTHFGARDTALFGRYNTCLDPAFVGIQIRCLGSVWAPGGCVCHGLVCVCMYVCVWKVKCLSNFFMSHDRWCICILPSSAPVWTACATYTHTLTHTFHRNRPYVPCGMYSTHCIRKCTYMIMQT